MVVNNNVWVTSNDLRELPGETANQAQEVAPREEATATAVPSMTTPTRTPRATPTNTPAPSLMPATISTPPTMPTSTTAPTPAPIPTPRNPWEVMELYDQGIITGDEANRMLEKMRGDTAGPSSPALTQQYHDAGAELDSQREGTLTWADGSNWRDGSSHRMPDLPLEPAARILSRMTCAQWEALNVTVFPQGEGYSEFNWHENPDDDLIGQRWKENLTSAVWGNHPQAPKWLERENFGQECG